MNKTWRERIAEARERGHFTAEDHVLAEGRATCACGEVAARFGISLSVLGMEEAPYPGMGFTGELWGLFPTAITRQRMDEAEALLDAIEDRALQLKRAEG